MIRRNRQFLTFGTRMRDFGRTIMRHYGLESSVTARRAPTPDWQADTETPLIWDDGNLPAPEEQVYEAETTPADESAPQVGQEQRAAARKPVQREPAAPAAQPKSNSGLPPGLLKLLEADQKRRANADQVREQRIAKLNEKLTTADPETAAKLQRRRGKMSVSYISTAPLAQGEEPVQRKPESASPPATEDVEDAILVDDQAPAASEESSPDTTPVDQLANVTDAPTPVMPDRGDGQPDESIAAPFTPLAQLERVPTSLPDSPPVTSAAMQRDALADTPVPPPSTSQPLMPDPSQNPTGTPTYPLGIPTAPTAGESPVLPRMTDSLQPTSVPDTRLPVTPTAPPSTNQPVAQREPLTV
ncbi:MAG: hypothetical protein IAE80_05825, partial [Anaerolinea sp.]|nr:hypothetical protein [Anaerolinea sp.]